MPLKLADIFLGVYNFHESLWRLIEQFDCNSSERRLNLYSVVDIFSRRANQSPDWAWSSFHSNKLFCNSQDDHKAFRRQLEDKRPIVDSNLLSGRQFVASEPPVSDASDSEGLLQKHKVDLLIDCQPLFLPSIAFDADSRFASSEDQSRELTRSIRREVAKLSEQWNHLINRSDNWKHRLDEYMTVSFRYLFDLNKMKLKVSAHIKAAKVFISTRFLSPRTWAKYSRRRSSFGIWNDE